MTAETITDEQVATYVKDYVEERGMPVDGEVNGDTDLTELGLDSMMLVELLVTVRSQLVEQGRLSPDVTPDELPHMETVHDLGDLVRDLLAQHAA
jgi:acyl carrier protein